MKNIIRRFKNMSDQELKSSLDLIYPSKTINKQILEELEERHIRNDSKILKYLLELKKMRFEEWSVDRLLLILFDTDHPSNQIKTPLYVIENINAKKPVKFKNILKCIKQKKMSDDFLNFVYILEYIIFALNMSNQQMKHKVILDYTDFILNFIDLVSKIKGKEKISEITNLTDGKFYYKETWLFALRNKLVTDQILFLIMYNIKDMKEHKVQIIRNDLQRWIFTFTNDNYIDYRNVLNIVSNLEARYLNNAELAENIILENSESKNIPKMFTFSVLPAEKTTEDKSLEWYKGRNDKRKL